MNRTTCYFEQGYLKVYVEDLLNSLTEEQLKIWARHTVFQDTLIQGVLDVLFDPLGFMFDDDEAGPWWFDSRSVQRLRETCLPRLNETHQLMVQYLLKQLKDAELQKEMWRNLCWDVERAWHDTKLPEEVRARNYPYSRALAQDEVKTWIERRAKEIENGRSSSE